MSKTIVVYGSLKRGKYNHPLLDGSEYLGETTVTGTMYLVSSYPALVDEGDNVYPAEVYSVSDNVYDSIEGMELGAGYKKMTATIKGEDGQIIDDATIYFADDELVDYCKKNKEVIKSY